MRRRIYEYEEEPGPADRGRLLTRGGSVGVLMAAGMAVYSLRAWDIPMLLFCVSFLAFMFRPFAEKYCGGFGTALSNLLKGFGAALLAGSLAMAFF